MSAIEKFQTFEANSDSFLSWFATQNIPMLETELKLGSLNYYHFTSFLNLVGGRTAASFGSDFNRKSAALKCAGEAIERMAMTRYFRGEGREYPKPFQNSNGWAVHTSQKLADEKALNETLERHLLLKSYFTFGWDGLNLVQSMDAGDIRLYLLVSRFSANGKVSSMVAAQSPRFKGVSFGYTVGDIVDLESASFWQSAIFEAVDKFLLLEKHEPGATDEETWLKREVNYFLETPFCASTFKSSNAPFIKTDLGDIKNARLDLSVDQGFPLYASFVRGGNLIPLFTKTELDAKASEHLRPILAANGIEAVPERHPIL